MRNNLITICIVSAVITALSTAGSVMLVRAQSTAMVPSSEESGVRMDDRPIRIALLNGCGRQGLAGGFADALRDRGYDVINGQGDNADSFDFDRTVVVDRAGTGRIARRVADDLGIDMVISQNATDPYLIEDVEIILGRDWDTIGVAKEVP